MEPGAQPARGETARRTGEQGGVWAGRRVWEAVGPGQSDGRKDNPRGWEVEVDLRPQPAPGHPPTPLHARPVRTDEVSVADLERAAAPPLQGLQHRLLERQGGHAAEEGRHVLPCEPTRQCEPARLWGGGWDRAVRGLAACPAAAPDLCPWAPHSLCVQPTGAEPPCGPAWGRGEGPALLQPGSTCPGRSWRTGTGCQPPPEPCESSSRWRLPFRAQDGGPGPSHYPVQPAACPTAQGHSAWPRGPP